MNRVDDWSESELTQGLTYAGFILLAFELVTSLVVRPIKAFYADTSFVEDMPFHSYEEDVSYRDKSELQACLLYLRDFMEALDSEDVLTIQELRRHRNEIAHELPKVLHIKPDSYLPLLEKVDKALFKLSNYRTYMEIGSDPAFRGKGIDWNTVHGQEYAMFRKIIESVRVMDLNVSRYI